MKVLLILFCSMFIIPAFAQQNTDDENVDSDSNAFSSLLIPIIGLIIAAGGIIASIVWDAKNRKNTKNEARDTVKSAVKQEIQENLSGLEKEDLTSTTEGDWTKTEMKYLTIASYNSSVQSGNFILLEGELRKDISELYTYIHLANNLVDQLIESTFTITENKEKFEKIIENQIKGLKEHHDKIITKSKEILKKI